MSDSIPHIPVLMDAVQLHAAVRPGQTWVDIPSAAGHTTSLLSWGAGHGMGEDRGT